MWFYCIEWLCYPTATFTWIKQWKKSAVVEIGAHHFNPDVFTDDILSCWADTRIFLRNIFSYSYFLWKWVSDLVMRFGSCCCWKDMLLRKKKRRENRQEVRKLRYTLSDRLCANLRVFFIFFVLKNSIFVDYKVLTSFVHIYELCYIVMLLRLSHSRQENYHSSYIIRKKIFRRERTYIFFI